MYDDMQKPIDVAAIEIEARKMRAEAVRMGLGAIRRRFRGAKATSSGNKA